MKDYSFTDLTEEQRAALEVVIKQAEHKSGIAAIRTSSGSVFAHQDSNGDIEVACVRHLNRRKPVSDAEAGFISKRA